MFLDVYWVNLGPDPEVGGALPAAFKDTETIIRETQQKERERQSYWNDSIFVIPH